MSKLSRIEQQEAIIYLTQPMGTSFCNWPLASTHYIRFFILIICLLPSRSLTPFFSSLFQSHHSFRLKTRLMFLYPGLMTLALPTGSSVDNHLLWSLGFGKILSHRDISSLIFPLLLSFSYHDSSNGLDFFLSGMQSWGFYANISELTIPIQAFLPRSLSSYCGPCFRF